MNASALGWQDIAQALARPNSRVSLNNPRRARGARQIPQETIRAIRVDHAAKVPRVEIARKYQVSEKYVYLVCECGLRDDEREKLR